MAADGVQVTEPAARKYAALRPHLDERQRRLLLGAEATELGRGGIKALAAATGCIRTPWPAGFVSLPATRSRGCGRREVAARS